MSYKISNTDGENITVNGKSDVISIVNVMLQTSNPDEITIERIYPPEDNS